MNDQDNSNSKKKNKVEKETLQSMLDFIQSVKDGRRKRKN